MAKPIKFVVRAAMQEDSNIGSVWIGGPTASLPDRILVRIWRPGRWWHPVLVDARSMDRNFVLAYNNDPTGVRIPIMWHNDAGGRFRLERDTIVISQWYRRALGIARPTPRDRDPPYIELCCKPVSRLVRWYKTLRACCQSPDPVIRLATRLGVLGGWLGLFALTDPIEKVVCGADLCGSFYNRALAGLGLGHVENERLATAVTTGALVTVGLLLWFSCRGRPYPRLTR